MKRALSLSLAWLFVLGLALAVQFTLGWAALLAPWRRLTLTQIALAVLLIASTYGLRALRQSAYFPEAMRGKFWLSARLMVWHNFYNNFLPMRSGELSFPLLAQRYFGLSKALAAGALLWFRVLDLYAIALIALLAAMCLQPWWGVVLVLLLPLPWWLVQVSGRIEASLQGRKGRLAPVARRVLAALPSSSRELWSSWFWTLVNWSVKLAVFAWLLTLFAPMAYPVALMGAIGGDLTSVLPIHSPAGLGSYEAGVTAAAAPFGLSAAQLVPAAFNLHIMILASTVLGVMLMALLPRHWFAETLNA